MASRLLIELAKDVRYSPERYVIAQFILEYGTLLRGMARPSEIKKGRNKMCFRNATLLALDDDRYSYTEGFALSDGFACPHAWCVRSGKVIDVTWEKPERCEYLGIIVPTKLLVRSLSEQNGRLGILDLDGPNLSFIQRWKRRHKPVREYKDILATIPAADKRLSRS